MAGITKNCSFSQPNDWTKSFDQERRPLVVIDQVVPYLDLQSAKRFAVICRSIWENQKCIARLPIELKEHLLSFFVYPSVIQNTQLDECALNIGLVTPIQRGKLDEAHQLTERLYGVLKCSLLNRSIYQMFAEQRASLSKKIVDIVTEIQEGPRGPKCLRECVETRAYLKVLRVFFFYKPTALLNHADSDDQDVNDGYKNTILHNAVLSNYWKISVPFAAFVLEMDRTHHLGLTRHKNCRNQTPLEWTSKNPMPTEEADIEARIEAQTMLFAEGFVNSNFEQAMQNIESLDEPPAPREENALAEGAAPSQVLSLAPPERPAYQSIQTDPPPAPQPPRRNVVVSLFISLWHAICRVVSSLLRWLSFYS